VVPVLFQAVGWLAVDKPAGVLVIPGRGEEEGPSLREEVEARFGRKVFVVHRLDRDTSGVLLMALEAAPHRTLSMAFEAGRIHKRYLALVEGRLDEPVDVQVALVPARRGRMRPARAGEPGKDALTRFRPVEVFDRASLVEAEPLTGRTHQIRVHLESLGHPLLVDHQYGRREPLRAADLGLPGESELLARTPLHASRLEIPVLEGIRAATLEAPLPEDMARTLEALRAGRAG
jgi:tRNA pseudouridine32 synthase/23S rRNA pseudouridine746 synthase/23S rRNA pseudouridine955/2504/2580 synthase